MDEPVKISVYTTVYNTKPYVTQCVESVLRQTYTNFEYFILDNGCTDGSSELLQKYAEQDARIKLIRRDENQYGYITNIILTCGDGDYITVLDSDDWLEPDFLKRLVSLTVRDNLDMACAGSYRYMEDTGEESLLFVKRLARARVYRPQEYPGIALQILPYLGALWGKIVRADLMRQALAEPMPNVCWALDTISCLRMLRAANGIGIDRLPLYHYRVRPGAVSTAYQPTRFDGITYFHAFLTDFVKSYGALRPQDTAALGRFYTGNLEAAFLLAGVLPLPERLAEYRRMLAHPYTQEVLPQQQADGSCIAGAVLLAGVLDTLRSPGLSPAQTAELFPQVQELLRLTAPRCHAAITPENAPLFLADRSRIRARLGDQKLYQFYIDHHRLFLMLFGSRTPLSSLPGNAAPLLQSLGNDDPAAVLRRLKRLAEDGDTAGRYALPETIRMLEDAANKTVGGGRA